MGKRVAREIWEYDSIDDFDTDSGSEKYGPGNVYIGGQAHRNLIRKGLENAAWNTAAINDALKYGDVGLTIPGLFFINAGIRIPDNKELYLGKRAHYKLAPGQRNNIITTEGYINPDYTVIGLTSTGTTCTAVLSDTDFANLGVVAGDYVALNWAKPQFYAGVFQVMSVDDVTNSIVYKTFKVPANATASPGTGGAIKIRRATYRPRLVVDGLLDYDSVNQSGSGSNSVLHAVIMSHAFEPVLDGTFVKALKYNTLLACTSFAKVPRFISGGQSDGLHITGPAWFPAIGVVEGDNSDNLFAAGAGDYAAYHISEGAIVGCTVDLVVADSPNIDAVRVWGTQDYSVDVEIGEVGGHCVSTIGAVQLISDASVLPDGNSWVANFEIKKCSITETGALVVNSNAAKLDRLSLTPDYPLTSPAASQSFLRLRGCAQGVGIVEINGGLFGGAASSKLVDLFSGLAADLKINLNNVRAGGAWGVNNNTTRNAIVQTNNCEFSALTNTVRATGASGSNKLFSASCIHPATTMTRTSTATLEAYGFDIKLPNTTNMALINGQHANVADALQITKGGAWSAV